MNRNSYSNNSHTKKKTQLALKLQQEEKKLRNFLSSLSESTSPVANNVSSFDNINYKQNKKLSHSTSEDLTKSLNDNKYKTSYEKDLQLLVKQCQVDMENLIEKHKKETNQLQQTIDSLMKW